MSPRFGLACIVAIACVAFADETDRIDPGAGSPEFTADWAEPVLLPPDTTPVAKAFGPVTPAARQPVGALSGRIVFMNSGHGWTFDPSYWRLQRPVLNEMNEDYGNLDQLNFFAAYCFNAGATVVSLRPLGQQTNEVILDNDSPGVTFAGAWADSTSTVFFGSPGDVPYRYATMSAVESATATYTPVIPLKGHYPVYAWTHAGSDRGDQLYRIRHTGGESQVRIPHHMVGNGWIYLGEYYFNAGSNAALGSVVISNLRGSPEGNVIIADAIRFGNGMGSVDRGGGISTYPREEENCRYWIQANLGQGQSATLYNGSGDDESDSWSAPSKMSAEMNREQSGNLFKRIHISFHSNAGGGRGTLALITGTPTPNQAALAQLCGREVTDDLVALGSPPLELPWQNRANVTYTGGYSEIDGSLLNFEMDATIIEVGFHDSVDDARLLRDPKARAAVGRAAMHAVVRYMNTFDGAPLAFLPEPPANVRARGASDGSVRLTWDAPVSSGGSGAPTGYVIYRSTNGYGFGQPLVIGNKTSHRVAGLVPGATVYFRVAAVNAGGESMPSETVACRLPTTQPRPRVLVVNAFDRYERAGNPRQDPVARGWAPPGGSGTIERVLPRRVNSFDYVVRFGQAIAAFRLPFDSSQNEAVAAGAVPLGDYQIVIWAAGQESVAGETFSPAEQAAIAAFRDAGGHLFVTGSDVAFDLGRATGPTTADRQFLSTHLKAALNGDANDNAGSYNVAPSASGIFSSRAGAAFDNGSGETYRVLAPDALTPGSGAVVALTYSGGNGGAAAIQHDGAGGGGKVVFFGFPFETITSEARREQYMADILSFFTADSATLVASGAEWRYEDSGNSPGSAWPEIDFDDSAWSTGPAELGFGDDDEATLLNSNRMRVTTYFRRAFVNHTAPTALTLRVKRDDGVAVYLNGAEVFRNNLPAGILGPGTFASAAIGGAAESGWLVTNLNPGLLVEGTNVIAVELHQSGTNSSDLSFDLELLARLAPAVPVPFVPPGDTWRYLDTGVNQGVTWRNPSTSDSFWPSGTGRFGFGGDGELTLLARTNRLGTTNITFYFRRRFHVARAEAVGSLTARMTCDDGAVVYLNGAEAWRHNMPDGPIVHATLASSAVGGTAETNWLVSPLNPALLVNGWNLLAVEVHQASITSSDVGFDFRLDGEVHPGFAPPLVASVSNGLASLAWPESAGWFSLHSATNLVPPVAWTPMTNVPSLTNGSWRVTVGADSTATRFFRLQLP